MMLRLMGVLVVLELVAACSSGVMQVGPDTYRISTEAFSIPGAESDAIATATKHCADFGKQMNMLGMENRPYVSYASYASATLNFKCVPLGR